ncbi:MAG: DUF3352 domain-containing protein [Bacteroidales bacterium]|nr:DUF3352 domain-containing protein [Bacteroidales bacterium]
MLKKVLIGIAIVLIPISTYFGYTYFKNQQLPDFDIYKAIPLNASLIIESNDFINKFSSIQSENKIWRELKEFPAIQNLDSEISFLKDLSDQNQIIKDLTNENQLVISAHKLGKTDLGFLFLVHLQNFRDKKFLLQSITSLISTDKSIKTRDYNNIRIYQVKTEKHELNFSFNKGILLFSTSSILLENAIRQSEVEKSLLNNQAFLRVQRTAGKNVDANLYINLTNFNNVISGALSKKQKSLIANMNNIGDWAELDVNLKSDAVLLNGFTFSSDSLNNYLNIFLKQEAVDHKMNEILPSNTALFVSFGLSNNAEYLKSYKSYLKKQGEINNYQLFIDQYKNKYSIDFENFFKNQLDEEIGVVITDLPNGSFKENTFVVMRSHSKSIVSKELETIITKISKINNTKKSRYISNLKIDKETNYKIYSLPVKNLYRIFFGKVFPEFENQYITFIDNFMIAGSSKDALSQFIHSQILQKTLDNDIKFKRFTNYLSSKSNFYFYTNLYRSPDYISDFLNPNLKKGLNTHIESIKKFQAFAVQFQQNNEMIYNNLYLQYIPETKEEAVTVWESHLDTAIASKPVLVTNHYTKENEIFVQDLNNKIYLINKVGRILWKLQLNEKINSEISQIDFYKNGKLQLLFSTKNKIHLIDRKGNYVERYPVKLRSPSTAGIALFDYDKTLDYRMFIPCENKNVYLYNIEGSLINGWEFGQTDTWVTKPLQHFRVNTNDYLIFADKYRVYILNRKGKERINVKTQFAQSVNNSFILETSNNTNKFVTTDTSGLVKLIHLDGIVETKQIGDFNKDHFFDYQDINADGFKDYIFLNDKKLEVIKNNGSKLFNYKFGEKIDSYPVYYYFSYDDRKIGIVSKTTSELFLFNSDGSIYNGFPLKGNTPFTIGYLNNTRNQFNLIVGSRYNFLYNYSVN